MRHEKTVSVSKIKPVWEPWEEDETPRKVLFFTQLTRNRPLIRLWCPRSKSNMDDFSIPTDS